MVIRLKTIAIGMSVLTLAACTSRYDYYDDTAYADDSYSSGYGYGDASSYAGYGAGYGNMAANCAQTGQMGQMGYGAYAGGYTQSGLRKNRYGNPVVATGNVEFTGQKSRYGTVQQSSASNCMRGYWTIPTYRVMQQPAPVVATTPAPTPVVTTTVQQSCPDGQYRMDNGDCAIMMTEEVEQYVPPVAAYPTVPVESVDWYEPIRK